MNQDSILFSVSNLNFSYQLGSQKMLALKNLNFNLYSRSITSLCGPSGSGKTTLLNLLGLIEEFQDGEIKFKDEIIYSKLLEKQKNNLRRSHFGFIFQQFLLFESLTALENVEYFLKNKNLTKAERLKISQESLNLVGLEKQSHQKPLELSGGQRQRVAIARALAKAPSVIIADEPTASLDQETGRGVMETLKNLVQEKGISVILSSHDPMALKFASHQIVLRDGQIIQKIGYPDSFNEKKQEVQSESLSQEQKILLRNDQ